MIPLPEEFRTERHDMAQGPCACGATHKLSLWTREVLVAIISTALAANRAKDEEIARLEQAVATAIHALDKYRGQIANDGSSGCAENAIEKIVAALAESQSEGK